MGRSGQHRESAGGSWDIEPIGDWLAAPPGRLAEIIRQVSQTIEGGPAGLYYRSLYAVTYRVQIADADNTLELFVKTYDAPRGFLAVKERVRGGRASNVLRMTQALQRRGFSSPRVVLSGTHAASGRTMLASVRADGESLAEIIRPAPDGQSRDRKRALLRALGSEVARLHRAGFIHGDLTPYNIFVIQDEPPRLIFLDHDRTRRGFPAGRRYRQLRNLVQLGRFDLPGLSNADRLRVFHAYAAEFDPVSYRATLRQVARMLARRRHEVALQERLRTQ
ncbi:MAG TPA: lipopolysaccharide kinase InaA family protein [Candidatus Binataceae bacterium]|nr:lipopolysaccharide kinase InaA family protein [Candidatus Binataceae bacterium]